MREPAFGWVPSYEETYGDLAAQVAVEVGRPMDPEQRLILDAIFAEDAPGEPTCFEVAAVAPRQNLKTAALEIAALTDVFVLGERRHVWTAHLFKTAKSAFEDMVALVEGNDDFRRRCKKPRTANGDEAIELLSGQRIEFHARSKGGGRGLTGDKVTLDEALFLQPAELGALLPTLATRPGAQVRYGSSAGMALSQVLRDLRDRGREGSDPRLAWLEWCAPRVGCEDPMCRHYLGTAGCALDRMDLLEMANPALGRRIMPKTLLAFRRAMTPEEFAREFLGWWEDPSASDPVFGVGAWEAGRVDRDPKTPTAGLAVAVSYDLAKACFGGATVDQGVTHVRPLHHAPGTGWVVDKAIELQARTGLDVVIDGKGPGADLIQPLRDAGVRIRVTETGDVLDACAGLWKRVQERLVAHQGYPELDEAVGVAVKRPVGERWAWGRKTSDGDISPLEAVTLAAWYAQAPARSAYEDHDLELV